MTYTEKYIEQLEKRVSDLKESIERYKREIAHDAKYGYSCGTIEGLAQNARDEEIEYNVLKDVIFSLKGLVPLDAE